MDLARFRHLRNLAASQFNKTLSHQDMIFSSSFTTSSLFDQDKVWSANQIAASDPGNKQSTEGRCEQFSFQVILGDNN